MKLLASPCRISVLLAVMIFASGCGTTAPSSNLFVEAGFAALKTGNAQQQQALSTLTPGKFSIVTYNGKTFYAYPDPAVRRLYVGSEAAYKRLRDERASRDAGNASSAIATTNAESNVVQSAFSDWKGWNYKPKAP